MSLMVRRASNADIGETVASVRHLKIPSQGRLAGGVVSEGMPNGAMPPAGARIIRPAPDGAGHVTVVTRQLVGETRYFDAAGYPGRTLGPAEARR
ncbi:MAG: hypothetical protein FWD12_07445 [Alphaproteobacteria bacterium]|nr:hypothetical protein [Alphaproteobacteria bacterium]